MAQDQLGRGFPGPDDPHCGLAAVPAAGGAANTAAGPVTGVVVQAGSVAGDVHVDARSRFRVPVPRQLPAGPSWLADRHDELSVMDELLASGHGRGPLVVALSGAPGAGKTSVALWWLHQHAGRFPDGQLHADLGGGHGAGELPADVLARWLRALGVPPEWIPTGGTERAASWRSVSAGRRLGILVENAPSAEAARMLLPGPGPAVVAVTSRRRLPAAARDGARFVHLGTLPAAAAVDLLAQIAGTARVAAEPEAARQIAVSCGGLPLAVCGVAGRLAVLPEQRIADAAAGLAAAQGRPDAGRSEEAEVHTSLGLSYAALDPAAARAYRLLGLHPGPDFSTALATAALDTATADARVVLECLTMACLLEAAGPGRYRFHELIRIHARGLAGLHETEAARRAVTGRIAGWYLHNAATAERLLQPYRHWLVRDAVPRPRQGLEVTTADGALDWLERERHCLRAVAVTAAGDGFPAAAWQLADAMWPLFLYRGHYGEQLQVSRAGLAAARECGDAGAQAKMLDRIGLAAYHLGRPAEAGRCFRQAGALWRDLGDTRRATGTWRKLGWIAAAQGHLDKAIRLYRRALHDYGEPGSGTARQAALTMVDLGTALTAAGQDHQAGTILREAVELLAGQPDPYNLARARAALGRALVSQPGQARPLLHEALEVMDSLGVLPPRAEILETLAVIAAQAGDHGDARSRYQEALTILPPGHPRVPVIRAALAALPDPGDSR
jgi:tetratricopeptide (TPR) repeat protein